MEVLGSGSTGPSGPVPRLRGTLDGEGVKTGAPELFIGEVEIESVSEAVGIADVMVRRVHFGAGARTRPHTHTRDQLLYFTTGPGLVALDGGADEYVDPGDFVLLPAGVVHMHGAPPGGSATHLSMMSEIASDFDCAVPAEWMRFRDSRRDHE